MIIKLLRRKPVFGLATLLFVTMLTGVVYFSFTQDEINGEVEHGFVHVNTYPAHSEVLKHGPGPPYSPSQSQHSAALPHSSSKRVLADKADAHDAGGEEDVHLSLIAVHLDLKGAPPRVSYYEKLFPFLSSLGVNGLLLEYEDMFPYSGELKSLAANNSYSPADIQKIQRLAKLSKMEVIPLVQTFGHLEFALKGQQYLHLRELAHFPNMVCPSKADSFTLVKLMLDEVVKAHPGLKYLHIGCDETWQLGQCDLCREKMAAEDWDNTDLFLNHLLKVAKYVKDVHGIIPLVWDDMFRHTDIRQLRRWRVGQYVQPVVWNYHAWNFDRGNPRWESYRQVFANVWAASAFKGATGADAVVTNISHHVLNHENWLRVFRENQAMWRGPDRSFNKIIITGWQRYNHFAGLCELLPVGLPSLVTCLQVLKDSKFDPLHTLTTAEKSLGFNPGSLIMNNLPTTVSPPYMDDRPSFPGSDVFLYIHHWISLSASLRHFLSLPATQAWAGPYNQRLAYSSPYILEDTVIPAMDRASRLFNPDKLLKLLNGSLSRVYDRFTVDEWMSSNVRPLMERFDAVRSMITEVLAKKTWPRQPLFK